jgi:hypothetical protein
MIDLRPLIEKHRTHIVMVVLQVLRINNDWYGSSDIGH